MALSIEAGETARGRGISANQTELAPERLRFPPHLEVVALERLAASERSLVEESSGETRPFGVVRRSSQGDWLRIVDNDLALLLFSLREPGPLPHFASQGSGEKTGDLGPWTRSLVLDGLLEVDVGGVFKSGMAAYRALYGPAEKLVGAGPLWRLSKDALCYGAALGGLSIGELAARLYAYPRLPGPIEKVPGLPSTREQLLQFLDLNAGGKVSQCLARSWKTGGGTETGAWLYWERRDLEEGVNHRRFKLYVSPRPEALRDALDVLSGELFDLGAQAFKVTAIPAELLRPDKLVVYFSDLETLAAAGQALASCLDGLPVHGVPFTAEVGCDGLLSWGVDPCRKETEQGGRWGESWRVWLTKRLAFALVEASADPDSEMEAWHFAMRRVALEGVDIERWAPRQTTWCNAGW